MSHSIRTAPERMVQLNAFAVTQMRSLVGINEIKQLSAAKAGKGRA